jgi:hypothetical protein
VTSRRHRRLPSIWPDGSSLAEGETVIVMNERVVETVNAGDPTEAFFGCPRSHRFWQLGRYRRPTDRSRHVHLHAATNARVDAPSFQVQQLWVRVCLRLPRHSGDARGRPANSRSKRFRRSLVTMAAVQADKPGVRHHLERDETLEAALE